MNMQGRKTEKIGRKEGDLLWPYTRVDAIVLLGPQVRDKMQG